MATITALETIRPPVHAFTYVRVEEHVGELDMIERPVPERLERLVELTADATDFALRDPRRAAQGLDEIVDLASAHAVHVGLHHHREQRPIDPAARSKMLGKKLP